MAGRGGQKLREFRQHVTSVRHWLKEIEYEGLIMCEVYSGFFGNCQVILPTINTLMLNIDDSDDKIKWLVINVAKLEEEQRHMLAEEEKKKADMENVQRRKAANEADAPHGGGGGGESANIGGGSNSGGDHVSTLTINPSLSIHTGGGEDDGNLSESVLNSPISKQMKSAWDKITIPKLEKYSGYDHPNPLWLLIKDGQIVYELHAANAPKMTKMVMAILANTPLSEKELAEMDFQPDPAAAQRRREKRPTKKQKEEAARAEAIAKKRKARMQKAEVVRPAEYIVQVRIADIHRPAPSSEPLPPLSPSQAAIAAAAAAAAAAAVAAAGGDGTRHPMLVLYTKDAAADDFTYYGQCERIFNEMNPAYNKSFSFPLADVQPLFEQNLDVECKFVLYDADSDHISKDVHPPILGDAYLSLRALVDVAGPGEGGHTEIKLKKHMPHHHAPLTELKSARDKKAAAAALGIVIPEEKHHEEECGTLQITTKLRSSEGAVTPYRLRIAARNLPSLVPQPAPSIGADGQLIPSQDEEERFGVAEVQPNLIDEITGEDIDPALIDANSRREYILEATCSDANATRAASLGLTDIVLGTSDPTFNIQLVAHHATKDDRVLSFMLYDAGLGLSTLVDAAAQRKHDRFSQIDNNGISNTNGIIPGIGLDGIVNSTMLKRRLIGFASISFTAFLTQRRQFANHITLPLVNASGDVLLAGAETGEMASLFIQADELNPNDGSIEPYDQEELDEIAAMELAAAAVVMSPRAAAAAAAMAAAQAAMAAAAAAAAANPEPVDAQEAGGDSAAVAASSEDGAVQPIDAAAAVVDGDSASAPAAASSSSSRPASRPASRSGTTVVAAAGSSSSRPSSRPGTSSGSSTTPATGSSSSRPVSRTATATNGTISSSSRPSTRPGSAIRQSSNITTAVATPLPESTKNTARSSTSRPASAFKQQPEVMVAESAQESSIAEPQATEAPVAEVAPVAAVESEETEYDADPIESDVPAPVVSSSSRPTSRPVSASQKLAHNLALKEAADNAEMLEAQAAAHAAATPATVVAETALSARSNIPDSETAAEAPAASE